MAGILKNRTDNDIKNKWNSMQRKEQRIVNSIRSRSSRRTSSTHLSTIHETSSAGDTTNGFEPVPRPVSYEDMSSPIDAAKHAAV